MSDEVCKEANGPMPETLYSFTYNVICDDSITEDGAAVLQSIDQTNDCSPEVTYAHAAGCYIREEVESDTDNEEDSDTTPVVEIVYKEKIVTVKELDYKMMGVVAVVSFLVGIILGMCICLC